MTSTWTTLEKDFYAFCDQPLKNGPISMNYVLCYGFVRLTVNPAGFQLRVVLYYNCSCWTGSC